MQAFYMFYTRAWEFCIGGIFALSLIPNITDRMINNILGLFGFLLIILSFVFIQDGADFLKGAVIIPCVGAGLVIYTAQHTQTWIARFLSLKLFVMIGLISYSLYLWHWPVITFYKEIAAQREITEQAAVLLFFIALALSLISYFLIEKPARKISLGNSLTIAIGAVMIILFAFGAAELQSSKYSRADWRDTSLNKDYMQLDLVIRRDCYRAKDFAREGTAQQYIEKCTAGPNSETPKILVIGNSHATRYAETIRPWAEKHGMAITLIIQSGLPFDVENTSRYANQDSKGLAKLVRQILQQYPSYEYVFFAARAEMYMHGVAHPNEKYEFYLENKDSKELSVSETRRVFNAELIDLIEYTQSLEKKFVILDQILLLEYNIRICKSKLPIDRILKSYSETTKCTKFNSEFNRHLLTPATQMYQNIAKSHNIKVFDPSPYFKSPFADDLPLYIDNNHVAPAGARFLSPYFSAFMDGEDTSKITPPTKQQLLYKSVYNANINEAFLISDLFSKGLPSFVSSIEGFEPVEESGIKTKKNNAKINYQEHIPNDFNLRLNFKALRSSVGKDIEIVIQGERYKLHMKDENYHDYIIEGISLNGGKTREIKFYFPSVDKEEPYGVILKDIQIFPK